MFYLIEEDDDDRKVIVAEAETKELLDEAATALRKGYSEEPGPLYVIEGDLRPTSIVARLDWGDGKTAAPKTAAPKRKPPTEPPMVLQDAIAILFADGAKLTKAKVRSELPNFGSDTIDNAIDWLTANGKLTRDKKTYRKPGDKAVERANGAEAVRG